MSPQIAVEDCNILNDYFLLIVSYPGLGRQRGRLSFKINGLEMFIKSIEYNYVFIFEVIVLWKEQHLSSSI